ncbi:hypothetical protein PF003_g11126 [Phytophthora fragariae]|nr:hypothetical protein PF003_g11126 [Phytophthora fragariae]
MEIKKLVWRDMDSEEEKDELVVALGNAGRGHEALRSCPWWSTGCFGYATPSSAQWYVL